MNREIKRMSASATAYARLAAKAYHAGNSREFVQYSKRSEQLRAKVDRAKQREQERAAHNR